MTGMDTVVDYIIYNKEAFFLEQNNINHS